MNATPLTVLGAGGFVGRALVQTARARGLAVHAPNRHAPLPARGEPMGHVIYCIGLTADFRQRPLDTVEAHVCVLRRVLAECEFSSLTYLSSTRVYAGTQDTRESAVLRVDPNQPGDLYNLSKLTGEALCLHAGRAGTRVARLSNVIGPRPDPDTFIDQLVAEALRDGQVQIGTAPSACKDYLALDDAVSMLLALATLGEAQSGPALWNVASGEATSNETIARLLGEELGVPVTFRADAPAWDFAPIDTRRLREATGLRAQPFEQHFRRFLQAARRA